MKLPQEQADAINDRLAELLFAHTRASLSDFKNTLRKENPLTELIAVARAAASDKKDEECTCGTDPERSCRYCGYFIRLDRALQALRATGKVEL